MPIRKSRSDVASILGGHKSNSDGTAIIMSILRRRRVGQLPDDMHVWDRSLWRGSIAGRRTECEAAA